MENIKKAWQDCNLTKLFEIPVTNKASGEETYIVFGIDLTDSTLKATHEALTHRENESEFIAYKEIEVDTDFSLDENLAQLHEKCVYAILDSDFFALRED